MSATQGSCRSRPGARALTPEILARLRAGEATVTELAEPFRPERLVCWHGVDQDDDPDRFEVTVTFEEIGTGRTRVTNRLVFATAAQRDATVDFGAVELGNQTMARLEEYLATL